MRPRTKWPARSRCCTRRLTATTATPKLRSCTACPLSLPKINRTLPSRARAAARRGRRPMGAQRRRPDAPACGGRRRAGRGGAGAADGAAGERGPWEGAAVQGSPFYGPAQPPCASPGAPGGPRRQDTDARRCVLAASCLGRHAVHGIAPLLNSHLALLQGLIAGPFFACTLDR